jgi:transposase
MDAIETLRMDVREGRISADRLLDLVVVLQQQLEAAHKRIDELEKKLGGSGTAKLDEPFSMRAEEKRQEARGKRKKAKKKKDRQGRFKSADKIAQAERTEAVYPEGLDKGQCRLSHVRPVWRLENRRAVLIAYEIYRGPKNEYGKIPGVLGRSEFGMEIATELAYLIYMMGLSFAKACGVLGFFQNLQLSKAQADTLLRQLSRHWEGEFEALCALLANSLVVHADETSWSINSVWALLSEKARVLLFGVPKDAATLEKVLDPATFGGIVISDDYAVYANFTKSQKCWAHLLRKAIKLALQDQDNQTYRDFADRLLAIYRAACGAQRDQRLGDAGRARKVSILEDELDALCTPNWFPEQQPLEGLANDFRLLVNEIMRLALSGQLFTFVTAKPVTQPNGATQPVAGTNNEAERTLRNPAAARDTGRANKAVNGARRQTILTSILESLRLYLQTFTLASVVDELERWRQAGQSCFTRLLKKRIRPVNRRSAAAASPQSPRAGRFGLGQLGLSALALCASAQRWGKRSANSWKSPLGRRVSTSCM